MSPEFEAVLDWAGSPTERCSCGRLHVAAGVHSLVGTTELEEYREKQLDPKEKIVIHEDADGMSLTDTLGPILVWGCECGKLEQYEQFLWSRRTRIAKFLRARADREAKESADAKEALKNL